jgi:rhamnose transport system permease protein
VDRHWCCWSRPPSSWLARATGSDVESARLLGLEPDRVVILAFVASGLLAGVAGAVNAARFAEVPGAIPAGLEIKVIAAVIVGGTAVTGGRGSMAGTVIGVALLGAVGTGLTFLGVSAYWERAIQGAIILTAILLETFRRMPRKVAVGSHA